LYGDGVAAEVADEAAPTIPYITADRARAARGSGQPSYARVRAIMGGIVMHRRSGFTLIELLVVIAMI